MAWSRASWSLCQLLIRSDLLCSNPTHLWDEVGSKTQGNQYIIQNYGGLLGLVHGINKSGTSSCAWSTVDVIGEIHDVEDWPTVMRLYSAHLYLASNEGGSPAPALLENEYLYPAAKLKQCRRGPLYSQRKATVHRSDPLAQSSLKEAVVAHGVPAEK